MATIIVDYENVRDAGLLGLDALCEKDSLAIFYSQTCNTINQEHVDYIQESGCDFEVVQLKNPRSNALDFYQATYVGELIANGEKEIALITKDKGFHSIKDYVAGKWDDVQRWWLLRMCRLLSHNSVLRWRQNAERNCNIR